MLCISTGHAPTPDKGVTTMLRLDELHVQDAMIEGKQVAMLMKEDGSFRYVDQPAFNNWTRDVHGPAIRFALAIDRYCSDIAATYIPGTDLQIGKTSQYFRTKEQAENALHTYHSQCSPTYAVA